jgi:hypothetical protein
MVRYMNDWSILFDIIITEKFNVCNDKYLFPKKTQPSI